MARIVGFDIPKNKRLEIALTYIYGIGLKRSKDIIQALELDGDMRTKALKEEQIAKIASHIQSKYLVGGDLKREEQKNIKRLISISCFRGGRHRLGLPVRGQRTRTNARTRKGKKKTVANKKVATK